jgi:hypothetical protein
MEVLPIEDAARKDLFYVELEYIECLTFGGFMAKSIFIKLLRWPVIRIKDYATTPSLGLIPVYE